MIFSIFLSEPVIRSPPFQNQMDENPRDQGYKETWMIIWFFDLTVTSSYPCLFFLLRVCRNSVRLCPFCIFSKQASWWSPRSRKPVWLNCCWLPSTIASYALTSTLTQHFRWSSSFRAKEAFRAKRIRCVKQVHKNKVGLWLKCRGQTTPKELGFFRQWRKRGYVATEVC